MLTAGSIAMFGVAGLLVVVPAAMWFRHRRANQTTCATPAVVPVELSKRPADPTPDRSGTDDGATVTMR